MEKIIRGRCVSKGYVKAKAMIIKGKCKAKLPKKEFILVVKTLSSEVVSMIGTAKGIIADRGGLTSHPAIVCREMKVPCIVGTDFACEKIKEGQIVELNATEAFLKIAKE